MPLLQNPKLIQAELARRSLEDYIRYTYPEYQFGWFNEELAALLTKFVDDVVDGKQPRIIITAPPRSGKSEQVSIRLPTWALGKYPDLKIIAASYSATLANKMSGQVKQLIESPEYNEVFADTRLPTGKDKHYANQSNFFEIPNHKGAYLASGVDGGITGQGADIGIIDDPVKNMKEARSKVIRDGIWDWYTSTFYTRLSPNSGILICMTRWHDDDLVGRLLKDMESGEGDDWTIFEYPAIAEKDEKHRKKGEALHPERWSLKALISRMKVLGSRVFNAMYQGRPVDIVGEIFKTDMIDMVDAIPADVNMKYVRGWDIAATKGGGDYTVGVLMGKGSDNRYYIMDMVRGQLSPAEVEKLLKTTANRDGYKVTVRLPQDPAAAGKIVARRFVGLLAGFKAKAVSMTGDKVTRATGFAAQVEAGNVVMVRAPWNKVMIDEFSIFPMGKNDDIVDSATDAFNELTGKKSTMFDL